MSGVCINMQRKQNECKENKRDAKKTKWMQRKQNECKENMQRKQNGCTPCFLKLMYVFRLPSLEENINLQNTNPFSAKSSGSTFLAQMWYQNLCFLHPSEKNHVEISWSPDKLKSVCLSIGYQVGSSSRNNTTVNFCQIKKVSLFSLWWLWWQHNGN